jgi:hypothetical protein
VATIYDMTDEEMKEYSEWAASAPPVVRDILERLAPNKLYRIKSTGQRCDVYSVSEKGTVTVNITGQFNVVAFDIQVFGVDPNELEECDLPGPDEPVGTLLTTTEEIREYVDRIRPIVLASHAVRKAKH